MSFYKSGGEHEERYLEEELFSSKLSITLPDTCC
jgi:hypothetical protein